MKDKIKNIILLVSSVVIFLILFELVLHLPLNVFHEYFDFWMFPNRIFYLQENESKVYFDYMEKIDFSKIDTGNIYYHLDSSFYCNQEKRNTRVIFLGDSVTESLSFGEVINRKKIYTFLLEEKLNNQPEQKVDVINYGVSGYNLLDIDTLLKIDVLKCNPDLIVYSFFQNDLESSIYLRYRVPYFKYRYSKNFIHHFRTYYFFADSLIKIRLKMFKNELDYKDAKIILDRMLNISKENNITIYIVNFPYIKEDYPTNDFIERYSNEEGINYLDIRKKFLEKNMDSLTLRASPNDTAHYNYYGHGVVADILYKDLSENDLIPK